MTNKYWGFMIIDPHENLHLALCLTHCFFLNLSNAHKNVVQLRFLAASRAFSWENEQYPYVWPVKLTFDKIQAVTAAYIQMKTTVK